MADFILLTVAKTRGAYTLNHPLRQRILRLLDKEGQLSVTRLFRRLKLVQSLASQHLAILRRAGLVTSTREGKLVYYSVNYKRLHQYHQVATKLIEGT